jgi:PAS domain-containing protein
VRLAGVNWDITEDLAARERLTQANDRLGLALSAANASVWDYHSSTDVVTWDERARDLYGIDPNPIGQRLALVHPTTRGHGAHASAGRPPNPLVRARLPGRSSGAG